jgi:hypothetical protein
MIRVSKLKTLGFELLPTVKQLEILVRINPFVIMLATTLQAHPRINNVDLRTQIVLIVKYRLLVNYNVS